jgi:CPA2 family monovalent cation:H+ antiporter-2
MHDLPLITTIAAAFTAAWLLALLTQRLGLSPIVGYLSAGVLIGPYTPGFVGDVPIAKQLAEVGVILLMFGVGLHFHLSDLLAVKWVAIPGALGQSAVATLLGVGLFAALGLPLKGGVILGVALSVASTVVLMRVLLDADVLNSPQGHIAVGWLLVEDILTVVFLVLIPVLAGGDTGGAEAGPEPGVAATIGIAFLKLGALVAIVMLGGSRVIPWAMVQVARLRSRELFTLTVLVFSVAIAAGAYALFGASMALGAFLAGMVVAQSPVSHQAAADALPMRDAFSVLFFVSVGMLFDPAFLFREPLVILSVLGIILIAKPLSAIVIVTVLGHSARTALTVGLGLAQIGEFSFIVSDLAGKFGLLPEMGNNVLVAAAIISITLNPLLFRGLEPMLHWLARHPRLWSVLNGRAERRTQNANPEVEARIGERQAADPRLAIVVGFGPVGRSVHQILSDGGVPTVVIDMNMDTVSELTARGELAIFGDATHESILEQAGMRRATHLVLTLPHTAHRRVVVAAARNLNSQARILVRAHYLRERDDLEQAGASAVVFEEGEAAVALTRLVLADTGADRDAIERKIRELRMQLVLEDMAPQLVRISLSAAVSAGGVVLELSGRNPEQAIAELAASLPKDRLPAGTGIAELALAREKEISTDLGAGVAVPHARCANLAEPLIAFGRAPDGIVFSPDSAERVRLVFLIVTPKEHPDQQLAFLARLAEIAADPTVKDRLTRASSAEEIIGILAETNSQPRP